MGNDARCRTVDDECGKGFRKTSTIFLYRAMRLKRDERLLYGPQIEKSCGSLLRIKNLAATDAKCAPNRPANVPMACDRRLADFLSTPLPRFFLSVSFRYANSGLSAPSLRFRRKFTRGIASAFFFMASATLGCYV